jgi:prepilin-type N-terminal cleavage/methylation domain-containing protein
MRGARGFTLIEMAVVIAVMGFLLAILFGITRSVVSQQRYQTTRARMANLDTAFAGYVATNKRLPCPADGRTASSTSGAGTESSTGAGLARTCNNNQQYGVVPWTTLGLTASDAEDGWGVRFTYRVGPALVADNAMDFTACDPAANPSVAPVSTPPFCNTGCNSTTLTSSCTTPAAALAGGPAMGLVVTSSAGPATGMLMDPRATITTGAAYVLISHGPEGGGGYDGSGTLQNSSVSPGTAEAMNFANIAWTNPPPSGNPTVYLVDDVGNGTATNSHFDDIVLRPGILALALKAAVGPRSH